MKVLHGNIYAILKWNFMLYKGEHYKFLLQIAGEILVGEIKRIYFECIIWKCMFQFKMIFFWNIWIFSFEYFRYHILILNLSSIKIYSTRILNNRKVKSCRHYHSTYYRTKMVNYNELRHYNNFNIVLKSKMKKKKQ